MIGIFDSGIGGLSVLKAVREKLPHADIVYFGDTENAPYGNKSAKEIASLLAMALRRLYAAGARDIVSACNSASVSVHSIPIDLLRMRVFEVVEMVEPTVEALAARGGKKIALFGTQATIRSRIYQDAFKQKGISIETVAIPELAGLVERGASEEELRPVVCVAVEEALAKGGKILSLSCTHYPFAKHLFEACVREEGSDAEVFDPAESVAAEAVRRFKNEGEGSLRFLVSKESPAFTAQVERLFGKTGYTIEPAGSIYWALGKL